MKKLMTYLIYIIKCDKYDDTLAICVNIFEANIFQDNSVTKFNKKNNWKQNTIFLRFLSHGKSECFLKGKA